MSLEYEDHKVNSWTHSLAKKLKKGKFRIVFIWREEKTKARTTVKYKYKHSGKFRPRMSQYIKVGAPVIIPIGTKLYTQLTSGKKYYFQLFNTIMYILDDKPHQHDRMIPLILCRELAPKKIDNNTSKGIISWLRFDYVNKLAYLARKEGYR